MISIRLVVGILDRVDKLTTNTSETVCHRHLYQTLHTAEKCQVMVNNHSDKYKVQAISTLGWLLISSTVSKFVSEKLKWGTKQVN